MFLSKLLIFAISLLSISAFLWPASYPSRGRYLLPAAKNSDESQVVKIFIMEKARGQKKRKIMAGSYKELVEKVRKQSTKFAFADLLVLAADLEIDSELAFNQLPNSVDLPLSVESKSHEFSHYHSLQLSRELLQIEEITPVFMNHFPDIRNYSNLPEVLDTMVKEHTHWCRSLTAKDNLSSRRDCLYQTLLWRP